MEYISHVDYKQMMENFKKGAPKNMLKEGLEQEGNAFTAGLAKAKKGQEFKVDGKTVKDTSNYDAPVEEYKFDQMYPEDPGPFEGEMEESHPGMDKWYEDFENGLQNLVKNGYMHKNQYQYFRDALDHVDPMQNYGHMPAHDAAKEFVDDLRTKNQMDADDEQWKQEHGGYDAGGDDFNDGEFWENEVKKMQEIAGVGPHDDGPEDDDEDEREKRRKKAEMDDEEAENAERDLDEEGGEKLNLRDPLAAAKNIANKYKAELKPKFDEYQKSHEEYMQAIRQYDNKDPKFREITTAHNALVKAFQGNALGLARQEMEDAGEKPVVARNVAYGYSDEDWPSEFVTALNKELKGVAEGLHMPPLQATGPTVDVKEDQAPFGMSVLSPDERKQLKEYINSYRTIKKEIANLLGKAGKTGQIMEATAAEDEAVPAERPAHYNEPTKTPKHKSSNLGGNRTGLVMTKAEMWENEGHEHEEIESSLGEKLHSTFNKVTQMALKQIVADGWDADQAVSFLQTEIEEHAKEATMSQYDPH